jgi:hypothetical protein
MKTVTSLAVTGEVFGVWFPMHVEPVVFSLAERLLKDYKGGYWDFYTLSNGGFYVAPAGNDRFHVLCENQFKGDLSADVFGITLCLYAYSILSFAGPDAFVDKCTGHFYRLREFMMEHPEVRAIY